MNYTTRKDMRLGVYRPMLLIPYEQLTSDEQADFELLCQMLCADIPEAIKRFETTYMEKFEALAEADEEGFFRVSEEMNEISSCICDLNLLFLWIEGNFLAKSLHA